MSKHQEERATRHHPFQRLQADLAALISSTIPGERLPAEPQLAESLGVSRATLREAMRTFEGQGLIRRRQGVGTFVVAHKKVIEAGLEKLESIEALASRIGLNVSMGDLQIGEISASAQQAEKLNIKPGSILVKVTRVIHAENRPVAYLIDILPQDVLSPAYLKEGFTGSVLDLLLRRGTPPLASSVAEIQATAATAEIARALQIQRNDVLLMFVARLESTSGQVVDLSYSYFLPGYFRFHVVRSVVQPEK